MIRYLLLFLTNVVAAVVLLSLISCATDSGQHGVYIAPDGLNTVVICVSEPQPNGKPFLFCYDDSNRGAW